MWKVYRIWDLQYLIFNVEANICLLQVFERTPSLKGFLIQCKLVKMNPLYNRT